MGQGNNIGGEMMEYVQSPKKGARGIRWGKLFCEWLAT